MTSRLVQFGHRLGRLGLARVRMLDMSMSALRASTCMSLSTSIPTRKNPLSVFVFSARDYDEVDLREKSSGMNVEWKFCSQRLELSTASLALGNEAVCLFVNDRCDTEVVKVFAEGGVKIIALRSAGFDNVDLEAVKKAGIKITRVPAYSPYAVAEHAVALMMTLNRKTHKAYIRGHVGNFELNQSLLGFDFHGKTAGIIGTGKIGCICARILHGLGMNLLFHDAYENTEMKTIGKYVSLSELCNQSDVISVHTPLTPSTRHMINKDTISQMKDGVMLINTSRGALLDTRDVIHGIKNRKIGLLGIDVYENERNIFFENRENDIIDDVAFMRLLSFPNVLVTGHQAFFTREALTNISESVIASLQEYLHGLPLTNEVK